METWLIRFKGSAILVVLPLFLAGLAGSAITPSNPFRTVLFLGAVGLAALVTIDAAHAINKGWGRRYIFQLLAFELAGITVFTILAYIAPSTI
jgi:hypothetical protein